MLDSCERLDIQTEKWSSDVPKLKKPMIGSTLKCVNKIWIYSFGDNCDSVGENSNDILRVEKLNT